MIDRDILAAIEIQEIYGGRRGTPETLRHVERARGCEGSLARLYRSGAISAEQLASAAEIASAAERLGRDVAIPCASWETRVDATRQGDGSFFERLGQVRREIAYKAWCRRLGARLAPALAMIVGDEALTAVARRHRMHHRSMRALLDFALEQWPAELKVAIGAVGPAELAAAQAEALS